MVLKLYNTLTRQKEKFEPIEEGKVKFYSCGQTIYDDLHIGNARAYVYWDTLTRYLRYKGYNVRHVQNITDVGHLTDDGDQGEDKVEKRANELGMEPMELVEDQIERYFQDTGAINVKRQDIVPRATGHINEMIEFIQNIIDNGYAYEVDENIYFDMDAFVKDYDYGEMAKKDIDQLKEEAEGRVEPDENKKNQYDFALWLNAEGTSHLMKWGAIFQIEGEYVKSTGYPGWHLECSVMSQKYLGDLFDIHAGGKDHIFPHHPNERAQCLAATGKGQANFWLHNEFITVRGEKMSKSEDNFHTIRELLEKYSGDTIRLNLVSSHYRSETDFSNEDLEKAAKELVKLRKTIQRIRRSEGSKTFEGMEQKFKNAMDDDLNTARAKQILMEAVSRLNSALEKDEDIKDETADKLVELFGILGVNIEPEISDAERKMADKLLERREELRTKDEYGKADEIRDIMEELGFEIEDSGNGAEWFKVA